MGLSLSFNSSKGLSVEQQKSKNSKSYQLKLITIDLSLEEKNGI